MLYFSVPFPVCFLITPPPHTHTPSFSLSLTFPCSPNFPPPPFYSAFLCFFRSFLGGYGLHLELILGLFGVVFKLSFGRV
ncbi:hypothetical protein A4A49_26971 [Nicotiana attenuata]|uniref:Uncharacterized protein n=1 Tax=Nicotiana attenuata TaxID=49451 RepID=A0A1J6IN58_NICAT|nr:hypothetical protein A4A49_26971 [Nicotiana attenuata]